MDDKLDIQNPNLPESPEIDFGILTDAGITESNPKRADNIDSQPDQTHIQIDSKTQNDQIHEKEKDTKDIQESNSAHQDAERRTLHENTPNKEISIVAGEVRTSEPRVEDENKLANQFFKLFSHIEKYPQGYLRSSSSNFVNGKALLRTNYIGSIIISNDGHDSTLTVEYSDTNRMKKRVIDNIMNFTLGDVSENAYALAYVGNKISLDEYEEEEPELEQEEDATEKQKPILYFCSNLKDTSWSIKYDSNECLVDVSLSSKYVFTLNTENNVRVLDYGGNEIFNFDFDHSPVSMTSFEQFVAIVYLTSIPVYGVQSINVRVYNIDSMGIEYDIPLALTKYSKLQWIGFSDEGLLYTQDSKDCVRMLVNQQIWVPIYEHEGKRRFWLFSVVDKELLGYRLLENDSQPNPNYKYQTTSIHRKLKIKSKNETSVQEDLLRSRIDNENNKIVYQNFCYIKSTETSNPLRSIFKSKIKDPNELQQDLNKTEVDKVDFVRKMIIQEKFDAAIHYALQIQSQRHFEIVLQILDKMKLKKVREDLIKLANEFGHFDFLNSMKVNNIEIVERDEKQQGNRAQPNQEVKRFLNEGAQESKQSFDAFKKIDTKNQNEIQDLNVPQKPVPDTGKAIFGNKQETGRSIMESFGKAGKTGNVRKS